MTTVTGLEACICCAMALAGYADEATPCTPRGCGHTPQHPPLCGLVLSEGAIYDLDLDDDVFFSTRCDACDGYALAGDRQTFTALHPAD